MQEKVSMAEHEPLQQTKKSSGPSKFMQKLVAVAKANVHITEPNNCPWSITEPNHSPKSITEETSNKSLKGLPQGKYSFTCIGCYESRLKYKNDLNLIWLLRGFSYN